MKSSLLRKSALLTTALAAVTFAAQPALAQGDDENGTDEAGEDVAAERVFGPLGGRIRTFEGDVDPWGGRIRTFEGDLQPFIGRIRTFEGEIDPSGGRIRTFEGDIDPFKGNIRTFWGDLTPREGELNAKIGRIRTFSDAFLDQASRILAAWDGKDPQELQQALGKLVAGAEEQWGEEIKERTGKNFKDGFADDFFAKWSVDPANLSEIATWDAYRRQSFLLDWYDNLLNYSGMDQVDHWMNAVNWTPALTQVQGGGKTTTIGVLDFFAPADSDVNSKTVYAGGYQNVNDGHGAAVSSLLVASHDGKGIMGIAPGATIAGFNPFDETYTASWEDVRTGIIAVGQANASVVNLSLGVSGYTLPNEWRGLFNDKEVEKFRDTTVYVIAAGNDGITQTQDVEFEDALDTTFIVVGSVDPNGVISAFSNRPGSACLLEKGECKNRGVVDKDFYSDGDYLKKSGLLMNRFLVAPGEMILVSDGKGGVTRVSGTSFAAPLVTGAIALIHDRWPWLKKHPFDVAKAILESAQDLGEPGVDPVYGWGLLDIEASQSALNFNDLEFYLIGEKGSGKKSKIKFLKGDKYSASWSSRDLYFVAFEKLVKSDRDFLIPLSSRLFNTAVNGQTMQEYMYHRFHRWLRTGKSKGRGGFATGLSDVHQTEALPLANGWSVAFSGTTNIVAGDQFLMAPQVETTFQLRSPNERFGFAFGHGDAAALVGGQENLGLRTDYNPVTGGANPLLGFASGGSHIAANAHIARNLTLNFAVTNRDGSIQESVAREDFGLDDRALLEERGDYRAMATTARLDYALSGASKISLAVTMLDENEALFGVRSIEPTDFGSGVRTTGVTLAAEFDLGSGLAVFGSAMGSKSAGANDADLQVRDAFSSAFQVGMAKHGVLSKNDNLRVTIAQPLTLERGFIDAKMIGVVDRETGEKGVINERFDLSGPEQRRFVAEGHYGAPLLNGSAEVSLFARAELRPSANVSEANSDVLAGMKFRVAF